MLPVPVVAARNIKNAAVASYELQLSMILPLTIDLGVEIDFFNAFCVQALR